MKGPEMMQQMESFFRENPDKYREFMKLQHMFKLKQDEEQRSAMTPKQKMELAKKKFSSQRMSKHHKDIIEEKEKEKETKLNEEKSNKAEEDKKAEAEKLQRKKEKNQRKYAKRKLKLKNKTIEDEFEVVEQDA